MTYTKSRCKECDSLLWSNHAKSIGLCPECEEVDKDHTEELETQLENLLK